MLLGPQRLSLQRLCSFGECSKFETCGHIVWKSLEALVPKTSLWQFPRRSSQVEAGPVTGPRQIDLQAAFSGEI